MKRISVIIAALIVHLILGNICLNSVVHAYSPLSDDDGVRMSVDAVSQCPFINMSRNVPQAQIEEEQESPCASGNCYKQPHTEASSTSVMMKEIVATVLPFPTNDTAVYQSTIDLLPLITESPPPLFALHTIVLRM